MEATRLSRSAGQKQCRLCQRAFVPHHKVKERQEVCRRLECQRLRQKLNHQEWLERNPVDYQKWYQDYGKTWRQQNPDYQRCYRQRKRAAERARDRKASQAKQILLPLLSANQHEKKEQLTSRKTKNNSESVFVKKEQLTPCFYLIKADALEVLPLQDEKKEQLAYCFS